MKMTHPTGFDPIHNVVNSMLKPYKFYILLLLLGAAGSLWIVSGTLPTLLFYLLKNLPPYGFLTFVFLASWGMTLIIGSALGTASIVGVLFISMATAAGLPTTIVGGAVLSGIYLGERTSPLSSCANLVAELTGVPIKKYVHYNWLNILPSVTLTLFLYTLISLQHPMETASTDILVKLQTHFTLSPWTLLPLVVLIVGLLLKLNLIPSILVSLLSSIGLSLMTGQANVLELFHTALFGYSADAGLDFLNSNGSFGMIKFLVIIAVATGLNDLLSTAPFYKTIHGFIATWAQKKGRYSATLVSSIFGSAIGFSQTVAILITYELTRDLYGHSEAERIQQSLDLANSAVLVPGLVPWNIAASAPAVLFALSPDFMGYAFFLLIAPLFTYALVVHQRAS